MGADEFTLEKMKVYDRLSAVEVSNKLIENKIGDLIERIDRHNENNNKLLADLKVPIDQLRHTVYGNGDPGLAEITRENVKTLTYLENYRKERKGNIVLLWVTTVSLIVADVVGVTWRHLFK